MNNQSEQNCFNLNEYALCKAFGKSVLTAKQMAGIES